MKHNSFFKTVVAITLLASSTITAKAQNSYDAQIAAILQRLDSLEQVLAEAGIGAEDATRTVRIEDGALPGEFSVSEKTKVRFSMGNLQYQASTGKWRFAKKQTAYVGGANSKASASYNGWIDLFAWGTSGYHDASDKENVHYQPYSTSYEQYEANRNNLFGYGPSRNMKNADLTGKSAKYDWGVYNAITNGGEKEGMWRTLTADEWEYLLNKRTATMRYCLATVDGRVGLIIYPDNFAQPSGVTAPEITNFGTEYSAYTLTSTQWNQVEAAGAVFLPAAGYRVGKETQGTGVDGFYWTASNDGGDYAQRVIFSSGIVGAAGSSGRFDGFAVRLVKVEN